MVRKIYPVVLSGGIGLRLWPSSTENLPKQFLKINSNKSLLNNTLERLQNNIFHLPTIIGNYQHRFLIKNELSKNKLNYRSIFLEPTRKNTMASISICTLDILKKDPNAYILVLPSDHIINPKNQFVKIIKESTKIIENNLIATFGIVPKNPDTSMGYIIKSRKKIENGFEIEKFLEKPKMGVIKNLINQLLKQE